MFPLARICKADFRKYPYTFSVYGYLPGTLLKKRHEKYRWFINGYPSN